MPVRGSVLNLYLAALQFIVASLALGVLLATLAKTQFQAMQEFVILARQRLASDDEPLRCRLEDRLLALLPVLRENSFFELLEVRDPALRNMLAEHASGTDS